MKKISFAIKGTIFLCLLFLLFAPNTSAVLISPTSASGSGTFNNNPALLIDGTIPSEGSTWTNSTNVYWNGLTPEFTIDLGSIYSVEDIIASVDNNDSYYLDYSTDNTNWLNLFMLSSSYGEISNGMDTMSTDSTNTEYIAGIDFSPKNARYLKIYATGGDNSYSVGELQAFGSSLGNNNVVPEPTTMLLFGSGLIGLAGFRRKFKKTR